MTCKNGFSSFEVEAKDFPDETQKIKEVYDFLDAVKEWYERSTQIHILQPTPKRKPQE